MAHPRAKGANIKNELYQPWGIRNYIPIPRLLSKKKAFLSYLNRDTFVPTLECWFRTLIQNSLWVAYSGPVILQIRYLLIMTETFAWLVCHNHGGRKHAIHEKQSFINDCKYSEYPCFPKDPISVTLNRSVHHKYNMNSKRWRFMLAIYQHHNIISL